MIDRKQSQLIWTFGVLERLTNLGMIGGFDWHIIDIDTFLAIDENRDTLFLHESTMPRLVELICKKEGKMKNDKQIECIVALVKEYRDNRAELMRFALERVSSSR
jgi:hypothetical protein